MSSAPGDEQEAAIALEQLRRSFDEDLTGHALATPDGRILACNPAFARVIGAASVEEAMQVRLHELEPQPGTFLSLLRRLDEAPLIPLEELRFIRRDGRPSRVLARMAATRDEDGAIREIRVYLVDISFHFRREQKLRARARRLHLAELATRDVLWDWDVPQARVHWNSAAVRRFRYTAEEVRSTIDWHMERIHPEDRERVLRGMTRAIYGIDHAWADEYRVLRGDGSYATVLDRARVVRNGRGEPVRVVGTIVDITELKATESSQRFLAGASARLIDGLEVDGVAGMLARLCVPHLADVCLVDLAQEDGRVRRVAVAHANPALESVLAPGASLAMHGDGPAPTRSPPAGALECVPEIDAAAAAQHLGTEPSAGIRAYVAVPLVARERVLGTVTFAFLRPHRCFEPLQLLTCKDLASRGAMALNNALLYELAQRAVRLRNDVLGVVSHDLRVPVNTIVATLSLLAESMPERRADVRNWLDILRRATTQIQHLIEDLLDVSRIEANQFVVHRNEADIAAVIEEACAMLRPIAEARHIHVETRVAPDLPRVSVDAPKVVRVVSNLLGNAIKFSPHGSTVRIAAESNGELSVSVHDEGPGIPAEHAARVFDRFWQARANDRRGSGLGLSIAKGIVEAHGGRIWVGSPAEGGSTFTFTLPSGEAQAQEKHPHGTNATAERPAADASAATEGGIRRRARRARSRQSEDAA